MRGGMGEHEHKVCRGRHGNSTSTVSQHTAVPRAAVLIGFMHLCYHGHSSFVSLRRGHVYCAVVHGCPIGWTRLVGAHGCYCPSHVHYTKVQLLTPGAHPPSYSPLHCMNLEACTEKDYSGMVTEDYFTQLLSRTAKQQWPS